MITIENEKEKAIIRDALEKEVKLLSSNITRIQNKISLDLRHSDDIKQSTVTKLAKKLEKSVTTRSDIYRIINKLE